MDRNEPAVAKLQDSFISHMVAPLAQALNEAGLLPSCPGLPKAEVMINLDYNHNKWLLRLEEERAKEAEETENAFAEENPEFSAGEENFTKEEDDTGSGGAAPEQYEENCVSIVGNFKD